MQKIFFLLILTIILFESCRKCQDVSVGRVDFMPSSASFLENLKGKKMTYKDSLGTVTLFNAAANIVKPDAKVPTKVICEEAFKSGVEFLDSKNHILKFTSSSVNIDYTLNANIINRGLDSLASDTLLYDVLNMEFGIINIPVELSKRGKNKPDFRQNTIIQSELTLFGKTFKNVTVDTNSQKEKTKEPLQLFFNTTQGVVAFRLLNGKLFVLDKIE